jgi:ribosome-binding protein aMBF1 (putative translation factor)
MENEIHKQMDFCRVVSNREFFGISPEKATKIIDEIVETGMYVKYSKDELQPLSKLETFSDVGKYIRNERKRQGLTQKQLAFACGTGLRLIGEIERGKVTAQVGNVFQILSLLRINVFMEEHQ